VSSGHVTPDGERGQNLRTELPESLAGVARKPREQFQQEVCDARWVDGLQTVKRREKAHRDAGTLFVANACLEKAPHRCVRRLVEEDEARRDLKPHGSDGIDGQALALCERVVVERLFAPDEV